MVGLLALCQGVGLLGGGVVAYLYPRYLNVSQSLPRVDVDFGPGDPFSYMVDNTFNTHGVAPDKGTQNGPVWLHSSTFEDYMASQSASRFDKSAFDHNDTTNYVRHAVFDAAGAFLVSNTSNTTLPSLPSAEADLATSRESGRGTRRARQASDYWLPSLAPLGSQPLAGRGYKFYRDVTAYGAKGDGLYDDTEAINAAIQDGNRCGLECGNTFTQGAIIYFPPGIYKICRPIVQLYYTQFIGHPTNRPTLLGCQSFSGIAMVDTDPYILGGNGANWYVNQNQFFRQIRNFVFGMTQMPPQTDDGGQPFSPTGIHWQVSQACSLQNLLFKMPTNDGNRTHVGIFMENGSGGFVSDLEFQGGAIGWRAGTQQYTALKLKFRGCTQAVQMVWSWGFNWQEIDVDGGSIGFNISGKGGITNQGVGSVSFIDCTFSNVPIGILTDSTSDAPADMVIDNLATSNVGAIVKTTDGQVLLPASGTVGLWAVGQRFTGGNGSYQSGIVSGVPSRPASLLSNGSSFSRSRPQYESLGAEDFLVATAQGIMNDGTGDQTASINSFLQSAVGQNKVAYFPAGIYQVQGTVEVPLGSRIQGSSWSQITGTGSYFGDMKSPKVMVEVGNPGDSGVLEIVEMLFTVKGATAGAILMEWNVHESTQGSAAMWDSHFRVGGATGSNLTINECPKLGYNENCIAASLLFHVTSKASGYFENVWVWTADHDNDMNMYDKLDTTANQISVYTGRGTLIESQGPSWFIGSGSEHSALYQYQLYNAKDIYLGHIQTETPYYQPRPVGPKPFDVATSTIFPGDPTFDHCKTDTCHSAWALRVIQSSNIYIHSAGAYSFFQNYNQTCVGTFDCQERLIQVRGSTDVVIFNIFTVGAVQAATGVQQTFIQQKDTQSGFTTEVSVWVPLDGDDDYEIIYIGPEVFITHTAQGTAPCILVLPSVSIPTTTINLPPYTTSLQVGSGIGTITTVTVLPSPITTDSMGYSDINVTSGQAPGSGFVPTPSIDVPPVTIAVTGPDGKSTSRTLSLPPWPDITEGPPSGWSSHRGPWEPTVSGLGATTNGSLLLPFATPYWTTVTAQGPTTTTISFPSAVSPITLSCPPSSVYSFQTPAVAVTLPCPGVTTIDFLCPTTATVVTMFAPTTTQIMVDCTTVIGVPLPSSTSTTSTTTTPLPVWTRWPPGVISPVTTSVDKPKPTGGHGETPCKIWFFWICIDWPGINIRGWEWILPPGIYPPGPPPIKLFRLPSGFEIKGNLPPWPRITIGPDYVPTYSSDPDKPCETRSASICSTTTSFISGVSAGTTTTSTLTSSTCATILGCDVEDQSTSTQVSTCSSTKTRRRRYVPNTASLAQATAPVGRADPPPGSDCEGSSKPAILYPTDPKDQTGMQKIRDELDERDITYYEVKSDRLGFTAFFWLQNVFPEELDELDDVPGVDLVYDYQQWESNTDFGSPMDQDEVAPDISLERNGTIIGKRALQQNQAWELSQISTPKNGDWYSDQRIRVVDPNTNQVYYNYFYHESSGAGQYVYVVEDGIWQNHEEFEGTSIEHRPGASYGDQNQVQDLTHGTQVTSKIIGKNLGISKRATAVILDKKSSVKGGIGSSGETTVIERFLESFLNAADDIASKGRAGKSVVSIAWGLKREEMPIQFFDMMHAIFLELDNLDTAIVVASGNDGATEEGINLYPARFLEDDEWPFPNLIVVGATNKNGRRGGFSNEADWMTTYAPGDQVAVAATDTGGFGGYKLEFGTSFAAPLVSGLIAYYRGLPLSEPWKSQLQNPRTVKALITHFHRRLVINDPSMVPYWYGEGDIKPIIWNAQVFDHSCLLDRPFDGDTICGDVLPAHLGTLSPSGGESVQGNGDGSDYPPGQMPPGGQMGQTITYQPGTPSPTCTTECGKLCMCYYCDPNPTGVPPDFTDPINASTSPTDMPAPTSKASATPTSNPTATPSSLTGIPTLTSTPNSTPTGICLASGAVSTCAMGPGGQKACLTSTTCTAWATALPTTEPTTLATMTTSAPPPPSPTPHNAWVVIALEELLVTPGITGTWSREWQVFSAPLSGTIDMCDHSAIFYQPTSGATGSDPGFPPTLGPFLAQGFTCTYKGTEDKLGLLMCEGVQDMWCIPAVAGQTLGCGWQDNPTKTPVVVCRW